MTYSGQLLPSFSKSEFLGMKNLNLGNLKMEMKMKDLRTALDRAIKINPKMSALCEITLVATPKILEIHKTNGATYSCSKVPVDNGEEFRMVIDGYRLHALIKDSSHDTISIKKNGDKGLQAKFAKVNAKMPALAMEFMLLTETSWSNCDNMVVGSAPELKNVLRQALAFVADNKDSRTYLRGVSLEKNPKTGTLQAIATNSFYLTVCESSIGLDEWPKKSVIVPTEITQAVVAALAGGQDTEVKIGVAKNRESHSGICFEMGNYHLLCPLIDLPFPKWKSIMPKSHVCTAKINASLFNAAIKRIGNFSEGEDGFSDVNLDFSMTQLLVEDAAIVNGEVSVEEVPFESSNITNSLYRWRGKFNAKLVGTALAAASDTEVDCHFDVTDEIANKGTLLLSGAGWLSIIMPKNI